MFLWRSLQPDRLLRVLGRIGLGSAKARDGASVSARGPAAEATGAEVLAVPAARGAASETLNC